MVKFCFPFTSLFRTEMDKHSSLSVTKSLGETGLDEEDDDKSHSWRTKLRNRKNELFALIKHDEEDETDFTENQEDQEDTSTRGLAEFLFYVL